MVFFFNNFPPSFTYHSFRVFYLDRLKKNSRQKNINLNDPSTRWNIYFKTVAIGTLIYYNKRNNDKNY